MSIDNFILYSVQEGEQEQNILTVHKNGTVEAFIRNVRSASIPRSLGWYSMLVGENDEDVRKAWQLVQTHNLLERSESTPRMFGMLLKRFVISSNGKIAMYLLDAFGPTLDILAEIEQVLIQLLTQVSQVPMRTLDMAVALNPPRVVPGEIIRVELYLQNRGNFPADIRSPAAFRGRGNDAIQLHIWKKKESENDEVDVVTIDLAGHEFLVKERVALPSDQEFLTIPPHGNLKVWAKVRGPNLDSGNYEAMLTYYSHPYEKGELEARNNLIIGEYHADVVRFVLVSKVKKSYAPAKGLER